MPPFVQSMHYGKKFKVMGWVISFMNLDLLRFIGNRVVILLKNPPNCLATSIYYDFKSSLKVKEFKDWFTGG